MVSDRAGSRQLAESALQYARTNLQASAMVSQTAALYRQLCDVERPSATAPAITE